MCVIHCMDKKQSWQQKNHDNNGTSVECVHAVCLWGNTSVHRTQSYRAKFRTRQLSRGQMFESIRCQRLSFQQSTHTVWSSEVTHIGLNTLVEFDARYATLFADNTSTEKCRRPRKIKLEKCSSNRRPLGHTFIEQNRSRQAGDSAKGNAFFCRRKTKRYNEAQHKNGLPQTSFSAPKIKIGVVLL